MRRLIVTGDDFGLALPVNQAIEVAHRDGVLTAASLMVGADAAADAVERARAMPSLRVGLHVVVVEGRPVLPPESVPALVDGRGELPRDLVAAGVRFFFHPDARRQLEAEIRAQFQAFRDTGLPLDHVNAHNHMHLHPTVLGLILRVGREFGLRALRVPREPRASWRAGGLGRAAEDLVLAPWMALLRARLRRAGVVANDWVLGLSETGGMDEAAVLRMLRELPEGVTEMYFHASAGAAPELERDMPGYRHEQELAALTSPRVRGALDAMGIRPIAFSDL